MTLNQMKIGQRAIIQAVPHNRLKELGLIVNTTIHLVSRGPFGDPLHISYYGSDILIDRRTAEKLEVLLCV